MFETSSQLGGWVSWLSIAATLTFSSSNYHKIMGIHQKNHQDSKNTVCTTDGLILTLRYAFETQTGEYLWN